MDFIRDLTNLLNIDYSHNYLSNSKEIGNNALRNPNVYTKAFTDCKQKLNAKTKQKLIT